MPDYLIFGSCLRSELSFPELAETRAREPRWNLRLAQLAPEDGGQVLSDSQLSRKCRVRISSRGGRLRYFHSCAGTFEISADGSDIVFDAERAVDINAARSDLVARLLLTYADQDRVTWLHGSAVKIGGSAIAFIGPSGAGKSTMALALAKKVATHICDDVLPIEAGNPPSVWPSDRTIRLHNDSKARLAAQIDAVRRESDGKFVVTHDSLAAESSGDPCPLAAIYLLTPRAVGGMDAFADDVTRRLIAPTSAIAPLIQHLRLGTIVGSDFPAKTMKQLGAIVASVPVFELDVTRDWSAIDSVVQQIHEWHRPDVPAWMRESA